MQITLSGEQAEFIQSQIQQGIFNSADQAVEEALKLLQAQYQEEQLWSEEVRTKVNIGADELARGERIPLEIALQRLEERFLAARESQA